MAIVKIHAIKTTLAKAITYVMNPEKTDGKLLVDSFGVTPETAYLEFDMTEKMAEYMVSNKKKNEGNKAYHMVQSFAKTDSITPEEALELGKQFADELLLGKYEYVIATHIDKGHIHNHIIFNATSNVDYKKFNCHKKIPEVMRGISNRLCADKGLSIIVSGKVQSSKHYVEWQDDKRGITKTWKAQMRKDIDAIIPQAQDFADVMQRIESKGYEIKRRGNTISLRASGQERFARMDRLGEEYSKENIIKRILQEQEEKATKKQESALSFLDDFQARAAAKGYTQGSDHSVWQLANVVSYLQTHNVNSLDDLRQQALGVMDVMDDINGQLKAIDQQINLLKEIQAAVQIKDSLQPVMDRYEKAVLKKNYANKHEDDIVMYEIAIKKIKSLGVEPAQVDAARLEAALKNVSEQRIGLANEYKLAKQSLVEIQKHDEIVRDILDVRKVAESKEKNR